MTRRLSRSSSIYRLLLRAYPEPFRRAYGSEMIAAFEAQRREPRYASALLGTPRFWLDILADLSASATRRRFSPHSDRPRFPRKRESVMGTLLQDLRYALRGLRHNPGVTAAAVLTLAIAIGANTAMFSLVDGILLRPFAFPEPDRLVQIWDSNPSRGWDYFSVSPPNFVDYREQSSSFESVTSYFNSNTTLTGVEEPERLRVAVVGPDYFQTFGIQPQVGRAFAPSDNEPGANDVVILSAQLWNRRFGGDPDVVGGVITLGGRPMTIVGAFTEAIDAPATAELWMPVDLSPDNVGSRGAHYFAVVGRLKPSATFESATADLRDVAARLAQEYPNTNSGWTVNPLPLHEERVGDVRQSLTLLTGAVALVLLIGCANIANLLLARAAGRSDEIAVRVALGAGRGRIVTQALSESVLLGICGGALGVLVARGIIAAVTALAPDSLPRLAEVAIDPLILGYTMLLSIGTGLLFGIMPALQSASLDMGGILKQGILGATSRAGVRRSLVVAEVAIAVVVVIGAGLLLRSLWLVEAVDPGFTVDHRVAARIGLPDAYSEPEQHMQFFDQLLAAVGAAPGVEHVAATSRLPMGGNFSISFTIEGRPEPTPEQEPSAQLRIVSPSYFSTLGIPLLRGRALADSDRLDLPPVVVINQRLADLYFPGEDPIGQRMSIGYRHSRDAARVREIVGIVGNVRTSGLADEAPPVYYLSYRQTPEPGMSIVVQTSGDPAAAVATLRRELARLDRNIPLYSVATLPDHVRTSTDAPRFRALLLTSFAGVALLLASIGIYSVMAYSVARRTRELGIRTALGADRADLMGMVLRRGLALTVAGVGTGSLAALALGRLLDNFLFGVTATDPATFAFVAAFLMAVALLACYLPARRATRVDPTVAMRAE
ncbi:MAG: ABC transporter permease [Acidobacteriota bacterium]|jgi:putative ABC transport system permease protein